MKKENKFRNIIKRISFQTQLFIIVLFCFLLFIILEYSLTQYSFRSRYVKKEIDNVTLQVNSLAKEINEEKESFVVLLNDFYETNDIIPLYVSSESGSYTLVDSVSSSYMITASDGINKYNISIFTYDVIFNKNDRASFYIDESSSGDYYIARKIIKDDTEYENGTYSESSIYLNNALITNVSIPNNINYLFDSNKNVLEGMDTLNSDISKFTTMENENACYIGYYVNTDSNNLFMLYKPTSYENTNYFIYVVYSLVETDFLLSTVSSYYGYILLGSILFAILIALFISRAFSKPVKEIEKEMKQLQKGNYSLSDNDFNNAELVSLESTLNEVKKDTEEKVTNIESQKKSLENLNSKLVKEEELRKSFIARLSHELKTPLMVVSATTEALMSGLYASEEMNEQYETILSEVDKTTDIIKDIISTYKSTQKEMKLNMTRFNLGELTDFILSQLIHIAQVKNLSISQKISKTAYIDADKELIGQVISNFITNAFKYTVENGKIDIHVLDNKEDIAFEIINYGASIKEENLEKIWLPFFRENENVDSSSTGMGLYIVKSILESHKFEYGVINYNGGVKSYFKVKK